MAMICVYLGIEKEKNGLISTKLTAGNLNCLQPTDEGKMSTSLFTASACGDFLLVFIVQSLAKMMEPSHTLAL